MAILQEDRKYVLTIGDYKSGYGIQITDLEVVFDVKKSADNKRSSNRAYVSVFNLSRETLGKLETEFLTCELAVGYRDTGVQTILSGNVVETQTTRRGTEQETKLILGEGFASLNHQKVGTLVAPGKTLVDVVEAIRASMPGIAKGAYAPSLSVKTILYGYPLNGTPKELLDKFAKEQKYEWRVDGEALYVSEENGILSKDTADAPLISSETGLIDIPYYASASSKKLPTDNTRKTGVRFKALMNPAIIPGNIIKLESTVLPQLNGFYRVNDVHFQGDWRGQNWTMDCVCSQVTNVELA